MILLYLFIFISKLRMIVSSELSLVDPPALLDLWHISGNLSYDIIGKTGDENGVAFRDAKNQNKLQQEIPESVPFPCNVTGGRSPEVPTSVNRLRPGDIDVIGTMGDSLVSGAGILSTIFPHLAINNRGVAAAGGGQGTWRKFLTLPNILKVFNPNLTGYALGDAMISHMAISRLNVATDGAMSQDMPYMAKVLIERMRRDPKVDIKNHWKLISLSIGGNNFCSDICVHDSPWSILEDHKVELTETLRILRDNLPRTLVQIYVPPHLKSLVNTRKGRESFFCYLTTMVGCSCMFALKYRSQREEYYKINSRWQDLEIEIAENPEFHTNDFSVVVQPFFKESRIPPAPDGYTDMSFLAADCFHVSQKTNAIIACSLWNNLLEPVGKKTSHYTPMSEKFLCPTPERPYLFTNMNSKV